MRVVQGGPEVYLTILDIEEQKEREMTLVQTSDSSISFRWANLGINYTGLYSASDTTIKGVMEQGGLTWEVIFHRTEQAAIEIRRPQEPRPPFEYSIEYVKVKNGDVELGATIVTPQDAKDQQSLKMVVLASGSGPQNRDCDIMGHKPFWVIADHLAKNRIGCLRFDDRGTGESTGSFQKATLEDFASDVSACVDHLRNDPLYKKAIERMENNYTFDEVPITERVLRFPVPRNEEFIQKVYKRIEECRTWLSEFEYIHTNLYK